jgi:hypothetical protein
VFDCFEIRAVGFLAKIKVLCADTSVQIVAPHQKPQNTWWVLRSFKKWLIFTSVTISFFRADPRC